MSITLESLTEAIRKKVGEDCGLKAKVKFVLNEGGVIYVNAQSVPNIILNEDAPTDCTIRISSENLHRLMLREVDPMTSYLTGNIKIEGNAALALSITKII